MQGVVEPRWRPGRRLKSMLGEGRGAGHPHGWCLSVGSCIGASTWKPLLSTARRWDFGFLSMTRQWGIGRMRGVGLNCRQ